MVTSEAALVTAIVRAIEKRYPGCWVFKVVGSPFQMTGVPDLLVVVEGDLFGLEVKFQRPGESLPHARGRVTPGQAMQIQRLRRAGATADVVTSVEEALEMIERARGSVREILGEG